MVTCHRKIKKNERSSCQIRKLKSGSETEETVFTVAFIISRILEYAHGFSDKCYSVLQNLQKI